MQGLRTLYWGTGRNAAWRRLVEMVVPDFIDPATDGPLPGYQEHWSLVTEYRVRLARMERDWAEAGRLQRVRVDWNRESARTALETAPEMRGNSQRHSIDALGASVHELAEIQREKGDPSCINTYREAFELANAIGETAMQATCACNLGQAYIGVPELRDLDAAERWVRISLDLLPSGDTHGRSQRLAILGVVLFERCKDAKTSGRPIEEFAGLLAEAAQLYEQALKMMPKNAITDRGVILDRLGTIYCIMGDINRGLRHYRMEIRCCEEAGNTFGAALTRFNVALALLEAGRLEEARAYAEVALANYQIFGERAAVEIKKTEWLIDEINMAAAKKRGGA
jgi:tetratricopeptide (TPR) repeat protein